jgi:hypothetical protein
MQCCVVATALAGARGLSAQTSALGRELQSAQVRPQNVRLNTYLHELASPGAFLGVVGGGVLDQIRNSDNGPDDLSGRIGTRAIQRAVDVSVHHGLAAAMHLSTSYQPCHCHGFGNKVGHALLESFTDRRDDGGRVLAIPRFASSYASGFTELAWNHSRNPGDVLVGTTLSFGLNALFNIGKELTGLAR